MANSYHGEIYKHTACSTVYLIPSTCESEKRLLRDGVKTSDNTEPSELHIVKLKSMFFLYNRLCEYVAAGLNHKLVDPDGGIHLAACRHKAPTCVTTVTHPSIRYSAAAPTI